MHARRPARASISLRPREEHAALQLARECQAIGDFAARYRRRAGVEGTIAEGVRACALRWARYRTLPKVRLEHVALAVGISLQGFDAWWTGTARAATRTSRFAAFAPDWASFDFPNNSKRARRPSPAELSTLYEGCIIHCLTAHEYLAILEPDRLIRPQLSR